MGSHTFTWPHQAQEVYVTGTFDNWQKTVKLEKHAYDFHKTVDLPAEKILYKFVVDGIWTTDHTAAQEQDEQGIHNNVLTAEELKPAPSSHSFLSSVAPTSTTAAMVGEVPLERNSREVHHEAPGAFPETPANEPEQFSVNPIPATAGAPVPGGTGAANPIKLAPGEKVPESSTYTPNKVDTFAADEEHALGVNPLPATAGIGNPIKLAPGEPVPDPSTFTNNTIQSTVSHTTSASGAPQIPPILSPQSEAEANGAGMFGLPPVGSGPGPMIPESSLPMGAEVGAGAAGAAAIGGAAFSSAAPQSTSAQLAGQVPLRERGVPQVVTDSEEAAHQSSEAAAYTEPLEQKSAVEHELKSVVPEARGSDGLGHGSAAGVPAEVTQSQRRAHVDPEAASSPTAVNDKSQMEDELKQKVPEEPATSSSGVFGSSERGVTGAIAVGAVAAGGALAAAAFAAKNKAQPTLDQAADYVGQTGDRSVSSEPSTVPAAVVESQHDAHVAPEASGEAEAVHDKADMEKELKAKVPEEPATSESGLLGRSEAGLAAKAAAGTAAAGAAVVGGIYAARDKTSEATGVDKDTILPPSVAAAIESMNNTKGTTAPTSSAVDSINNDKGTTAPTASAVDSINNDKGTTAPTPAAAIDSMKNKGTTAPTSASANGFSSTVPNEVKESQKAAHDAPEASANPEAVAEKSQMEKELLSEVKPHNESGEPAPTASAALSATAPATSTSEKTSLSPPGEPTLGAPSEGLNAGGNSQAQSLATKTGALANAEKAPVDPASAPSTSSNLTESANKESASAPHIAERAVGADTAATEPFTSSSTAPAAAVTETPAPNTMSSATEQKAQDTPKKEKSLFDPKAKSNTLAAPEGQTPADSRDVSPMSKSPRKDGDADAAFSTPSSTPQKDKSKRNSILKGTPESSRTTKTVDSSASKDDAKPKKKGFLAKLKEKLKG